MSEQESTTFFDEGVEADLGFGNKFVFYPLSWGAMRRLRKQWDTVFSGNTAPGDVAWQDAVADLLYASIKRGVNGSTTIPTQDEFLDMLDMRNVSACFKALTAANGLRKKDTSGEANGEVPPTNPPTGGSTITS